MDLSLFYVNHLIGRHVSGADSVYLIRIDAAINAPADTSFFLDNKMMANNISTDIKIVTWPLSQTRKINRSDNSATIPQTNQLDFDSRPVFESVNSELRRKKTKVSIKFRVKKIAAAILIGKSPKGEKQKAKKGEYKDEE